MANRRADLVDRRGPREPSLLRVFGHLHRPRRRRRDGRRPEHRRRARSTAVAASRPSGPRLGAAAGPDTCPTPVRAGHDVQDGALWVLQGRTGLSPLGRPVRPSARRPCSSPRHAGHGGARPRTREGTCPPAIPAAAAGRRTTCSALPSLTAGQWTWWFLARARRGGGRVGHAGPEDAHDARRVHHHGHGRAPLRFPYASGVGGTVGGRPGQELSKPCFLAGNARVRQRRSKNK